MALLPVAVKVILVTPPAVPTAPALVQCHASTASLNWLSSGVQGIVPVALFGDWSAHEADTLVIVVPDGAFAEPKQLTTAPGVAVEPATAPSQLGARVGPAAFCVVAAW